MACGRRVYAVDLSKSFCDRLRAKVKKTGADVHVIRADMRTFRLPEVMDIVTCQFDSLNHLPTKDNLHDVFSCVHRSLRNGGQFLFDVYMADAHRSYWPYLRQTAAGAGWRTSFIGLPYDKVRKCGRIRVTSFEFRESHWLRQEETINEISWTDTQLQTALKHAGMNLVHSWSDQQLGIELECPGRRFYLARKAA
jgi:SAM-dependent methyltransferase